MRGKLNWQQGFIWYRPSEYTDGDEVLRAPLREGWLRARVYRLPASECRVKDGLSPAEGLRLVLEPGWDLRAGDVLRPIGDMSATYELTDLRVYPAHVEALLQRRLTDVAGEVWT